MLYLMLIVNKSVHKKQSVETDSENKGDFTHNTIYTLHC